MIETPETIIFLFDRTLTRIFGRRYGRDNPHKSDEATARDWLELGCDAYIATIVFHDRMGMMHERHLRTRDENDRANVPGTLKVFTSDIEMALRVNNGGGMSMWEAEESRWRSRLTAFFGHGFWLPDMWGPSPKEHRCRAPVSVLEEFKKRAPSKVK